PARAARPADATLPPFPPPEMAPPANFTRTRQGRRERELHEDATSGATTFTIHRDRGAVHLHDINLFVDGGATERFSIVEGDPLSAKADLTWRYRVKRGDWDIRTECRTVLTASKEAFHLRAWLDAFEGETRVFAKNWSFDIPRDGV